MKRHALISFSRWALVALVCLLMGVGSGCGARQDRVHKYPEVTQDAPLPASIDAMRTLRDAAADDAKTAFIQAYVHLLYVDVDRALEVLMSPVFDEAEAMLRIGRMALLLAHHEDAIEHRVLEPWVQAQDPAQMVAHERVLFTELQRALHIDAIVREDADTLPSALPYGGADSWTVYGPASETWIEALDVQGDAGQVDSIKDLPRHGPQRVHTYPTQLGRLMHNPVPGYLAYYESFVRVDEPTRVAVTRFDAQDYYSVWIGETQVLQRGAKDAIQTGYQTPVVDLEPGVHRVLMAVLSSSASVQPPHLIALEGSVDAFDADLPVEDAPKARLVDRIEPDLSASLAEGYSEDTLTWLVHAAVAMLSDDRLAYALVQDAPQADHPLMAFVRAHLWELTKDAPFAEGVALNILREQPDEAREEYAGLALKEAQILFQSSQDIDALEPLSDWVEREELPPLVLSGYIGMLRRIGMHALAFHLVKELRTAHPQWCEAWSEYFRLALEERDLLVEADFENAPAHCPALRDVERIVTEQWRGRYDTSNAATYRKLVRSAYAPERVSNYFWDLLKTEGTEAARTFLEHAESYGLTDVDTIAERAALTLLESDEEDLTRLLEEFVAAHPERRDTRIVLALLAERPIFEDLRIDGQEVLKAYQKSEGFDGAKSDIVHILSRKAWRVFEGGGAVRVEHEILELNSMQAIEYYGELDIDDDSDVLQIRVIKPDGSVRSPERSDQKESLSLSDVEVGDVIETESFRLFEESHDGVCRIAPQDMIFASHFGGPMFRSELKLIYPQSCEDRIEVETFHYDGEYTTQPLDDGETEHVWTVSEQPAITMEGHMSPYREYGPWARFFTVPDLSRELRPYRQRVETQTTPDPAITARTRKVIRGAKSDEEMLRAIFADVRDNVEEAGMLFSTTARRTARAERGDRLSLLYAMIEAAGFTPEFAWVRAADEALVESPHRFMQDFSGYVLRVKTKDDTFWLTLDSDYTPFDWLDPYYQKQPAILVTGPQRDTFIETPAIAGEKSAEIHRAELWLDASGDARAEWTWTLQDLQSVLWRDMLAQTKSSSERQQNFERLLSDIYGQVSLDRYEITHEKDVDAPLVVSLKGRIEGLANTDGTALEIDDSFFASTMLYSMTSAAHRVTPLMNPYSSYTISDIRIHPPKGYALVRGLSDEEVQYEDSRFTRAVQTRDDAAVAWTVHVEVPAMRVTPEDYPEFMQFGQKVRNLERVRLEWRAQP